MAKRDNAAVEACMQAGSAIVAGAAAVIACIAALADRRRHRRRDVDRVGWMPWPLILIAAIIVAAVAVAVALRS